ncbi:serine hydrolase [Patescibacteria group bacterium]|nr:serine hydrolase [Patescibacteria group bacterium]
MSNFFIAFLLFTVALLPNSSKSNFWEEKLRERLDNRNIESEEITIDSIPEEIEAFKEASVGARSAYFIDVKSGKILFDKNSEVKLPVASIAKLMTAVTVIGENELDEVVTISSQRTQLTDSTMGLILNDRLTIGELLHGLLINSGSDAALNLAAHTSGSEKEFVSLMNNKAKIFGLDNTNFTNPVGWDEVGNYSTAKDVANLARIALTSNTISEITTKKYYVAKSLNGRQYFLNNTNQLLGQNGYSGIKTGTTYRAGECLVTYYQDTEKEIVGVILNSPARYNETKYLVNWLESNFDW